jgi:hypothetical protein
MNWITLNIENGFTLESREVEVCFIESPVEYMDGFKFTDASVEIKTVLFNDVDITKRLSNKFIEENILTELIENLEPC